MRTTRPPVVDGLSLALQAASSNTSTSTTATIQASYAIAPDFFNGLLARGPAGTPVSRSWKGRPEVLLIYLSTVLLCDVAQDLEISTRRRD
jgi:hypothetical protein